MKGRKKNLIFISEIKRKIKIILWAEDDEYLHWCRFNYERKGLNIC